MLEPLKQWYCDTCGDVIATADEAYVIWHKTDASCHDFRIIHQTRCDDKDFANSMHLDRFLGQEGANYLLTFLGIGPIKKGLGRESGPDVVDFDGFVDFFRRVQLPHYEEARRRFLDAEVLERYNDANEYYPYQAEELERLAAEEVRAEQ